MNNLWEKNTDFKDTKKIYSKNADYQKFEVLKTNRNKRYKYREFLTEGVRNINEAIKNGWIISSFIYTREKSLSDWAKDVLLNVKTEINFELTGELMSELSGKSDTSELMAIIKMREDSDSQFVASKLPLFALFDRPSNKGNLGTIIRSCDALGVDGLILTGHSVDLYDIDVIVSSMGSFFKVPVIRMTQNKEVEAFINKMKQLYPQFKTIGTTAHSEKVIFEEDLSTPLILFIGNETDGLSEALKSICDSMVSIPMDGTSSASSFNVGCAATVMFYETMRQRL